MSISSRFAVGIHILALLEINKDGTNSSAFIASSVNTNPVLIRKLLGMLKKAELVEVQAGVAGAKLAKKPEDITLLDIYKAVNVVQEKELFSIHDNPNQLCPVGRNIQESIEPIFTTAQLTMEKIFSNITLEDVISDIKNKLC